MKNFRISFVLLCSSILFVMCKQPENNQGPTTFEEKVFVVNTVDNDEKLQEYLTYHKQVWPEVEAGFKKAGYKRITLYHFKDLIVMTISVPVGADLDEMGKVAEAHNPKCASWNKLMNTYQKGVNGTEEGEKWVEALPFYEFNN
ncbi:L-rhamnose mutarotase [Sphingobacterium anhuiense]|uniref:L-rhamnose mutarotase n=1 Tax=Sphingobacterium anhuiense TaxID=493780 RepID=A0ABW5YW74_9SPHI